ncbi:hypothetical protein CSB37_03380 [bacterium DOLZORAL124_38_8]|nr:MAG: hypothetical protein CSB37_03380 [bacterium DOLZORAL124_38_8]
MIERICRKSGEKFEITKDDLEFYAKMGVITAEQLEKLTSLPVGESASISESNILQELLIGLPTLCPDERQRRRYSWINLRNLYKRTCVVTGKELVSIFSPDIPLQVVDIEYWWSDEWDGRDFGRDFDFSKPFFEQFKALLYSSFIPPVSRNFSRDENSDYTHAACKNKNCYLIFDSGFNEDCCYSFSINNCQDCFDCFRVEKSQLCFECIDCLNCYECLFTQNSTNCSSVWFSKNCIGCENCFGCVNLRNKKYYFLNKPYTKREYEQKINELSLETNQGIYHLRKNFLDFVKKFPHKFIYGVQNENVLGDYLTNSKNACYCFDSRRQEDCKYIQQGWEDAKDAMDCTDIGLNAELLYECTNIGDNVYRDLFSTHCFPTIRDSHYCYFTNLSKNLFGCVGLRNAQYCILNKQYSKEEYFELREKIINHMKQTGEWGEFFPVALSPLSYNQTFAQEYYPLTKDGAEKRGYKWKEETINKKYETLKQSFDWNQIPDDIQEVGDNILTKVLFCERSGKPYQIQKAELKFYRKMNLPIPRLHPDERHKDRMKLRNPRKLYQRTCADCQKAIQTTFAPDRPEKILCEDCYLKVVD